MLSLVTVILFPLFTAPTATAADTGDWRHCVKSFTLGSWRVDPQYGVASAKHKWRIDPKTGKVTVHKATDPDMNKTTAEDGSISYTFKSATADGSGHDTFTVHTAADGTLKSVQEQLKGSPVVREQTFAVRNGVCFPEKEKFSDSATKVAGVNWHHDACRELEDFAKRNPDALHCQCGTQDTQAAVEAILKKHDVGFDNSADGSMKNKGGRHLSDRRDHHGTLAAFGTGSYIKAMSLLDNCENEGGILDAMADPRLAVANGPVPENKAAAEEIKGDVKSAE